MSKLILKTAVSVFAFSALTSSAFAQSYHSSPMTGNDLRATGLSSSWQSGENTITMGEDGKVMFLYGKAQPTIICAPLRLCDLELQAGEEVLNVFSGDSVRWKFEGARSGLNGKTPHLLIKPTEPNISTSLVITTSKRSYSIFLKSSSSKYMARAAFDYVYEPSDLVADLQATPVQVAPAPVYAPPPEPVVEYVATLPGFKSVDQLDFDYKIKGKAKWKPLRVFNDGSKTYIEMDEKISSGELPIFQVEGSEGKKALVNSRFIDNRFIVDQIFDEGFLVLGVGRRQEVVTIKRDN